MNAYSFAFHILVRGITYLGLFINQVRELWHRVSDEQVHSTTQRNMNRIENFYKRELKCVTLSNGMKCCFINDMNQEETGIRIAVGGGTESEPSEYSGLSRLCLRLLFAGSERYSGAQNFKQFMTDNELTCYTIQHLSNVTYEAFVPEFALEELFQRILDAFENPEFTSEGLNYAVDGHYLGCFKSMHNDDFRFWQVSLKVLSEDTIIQKRVDWLADIKRTQKLLQEYHDKYFKPDNMTVIMTSNLSVSEQYDHVRKSLGLLDGKFNELHDHPRPSIWKIAGRNDELSLTKAFTMNPTKKLAVEFNLPDDTSVSSSLYLGYLFVKSDPGSLSYYLKSEGLITGIEVKHLYGTLSFQSLMINLHLTEEGDENIEKVLSALIGYLDLVKSLSPSKTLFDQSRQYFLNERINDDLSILMDKYSAVFTVSRLFELSPNDDDLLFPDVPLCFDPVNITKTAGALCLSNCAATVLSDRYANTPMHRDTEIFLQYSTEYVKINPCFHNISLPEPSRIFCTNEFFPIQTSETELSFLNPDMCVKTIATATRAQLTMKIKSWDFASFPLSVKQLYACIIQHKMWILSDGTTFNTRIRADDSSITVDLNSIPSVLPQVMATLIEFLGAPVEDEYLKIKQRDHKKYEKLLCGSDAPSLDFYSEQFVEKSNNVQSMIDALQNVQSKDDLPHNIKGKVTLLLGGRANKNLALELHDLAKSLNIPDSTPSSPCSTPAQIGRRDVEQQKALIGPISIATKKDHSVCLKNLDLGVFSYSNWCQATILAEIFNTLVLSEIQIRTSPLAAFTAKATLKCGRVRIFMKASHSISASTLAKILNDCVLECLKNFLDHSCDNIVVNERARCANVLLTMKEDLQCEMARICAPIDYDLPVIEYWSEFPKHLWKTSSDDMVDLCSRLIAEDVVHNAPTCLFLSEPDTMIPQELLWDMEMPLFRLYQPISSFKYYPKAQTSQNDHFNAKRTYSHDPDEEQTTSALQLEEAFVTANSLATLAKLFLE